MKFRLHNLKNLRGRLGCIFDIERLPSFKLETPNILFYAQSGCIPHLTYDVIQQFLTKENISIQVPLPTLYHFFSSMEKLQTGLNSFIGMPECLSYFTISDPVDTNDLPFVRNDGIVIHSRYEKSCMCKEVYMDIIECIRPDIYLSYSDAYTNLQSSSRRKGSSYNITMNAIQYCIDRHISSDVLKTKGFIASLVGGDDLELRENCAKTLSSYPISGYTIGGLGISSKYIHQMQFESIRNIISVMLPHLPGDRLRIIHGPWNPLNVLKLVKLGVDLFDTTYPVVASNNGFALTFNFNVDNLFDDDVELAEYNEDNVAEEKIHSSERYVSGYEFRLYNFENELLSDPHVTNLKDPCFSEDFSPVLPGCDCLCCQKYTKAYIYHLLECKNFLAFVLLSIHNLHHYLRFFKKIRETIYLLDKIDTQKEIRAS